MKPTPKDRAMTPKIKAPGDVLLLQIAAKHLYLETRTPGNNSSLEVHEKEVWSIRAALKAAFAAGGAAATKRRGRVKT